MELQEVGRYEVEPFALERILELHLTKKVNEHARLSIRGVLKEGEEAGLVDDDWDEKAITLKEEGKTLFCGVASGIGVVCENGVYYLEAEAVSWTIKLDLEKKKRSFQEKGLSYKDIAEKLAKEASGKAECNAPEKKVENLLLEYRETDWEFLKRLASHSNSVLVPDPKSKKPEFAFGVKKGEEYKDDVGTGGDFAIRKKVARYRKMSQCEGLSYEEKDATEYTLDTDHAAFEIGDMVKRDGKELYVKEVDIRLDGSVFTCRYGLATKKGLSVKKASHPYASGLTLDGTVLKAEGDTVKVHLAIDDSQDEGKAYPFPYATGYSAEGHTGWYVMPEKGDTVQIVFPTEDENQVYAVQSVRKEDTDKTADPEVKYLRTPNGKEIKLDKEEILITANDDVTYIKINEKSGVEIITDKAVQVTSGGSVTVNSGDQISMTSANDFSINAGKNLSVTAADSITMTCHENSMKFETPSTGIEMSATKPVKVTGGDTIDITSKGKFTAKSSNEFQITADQKLETESKQTLEIKCKDNTVKLESGGKGVDISSGKAISVDGKNTLDIKSAKKMDISSSQDVEVSAGKKMSLSASSKFEQECSGSSIKLDGNIDMKAKLIKEN